MRGTNAGIAPRAVIETIRGSDLHDGLSTLARTSTGLELDAFARTTVTLLLTSIPVCGAGAGGGAGSPSIFVS